MREGLEKRRKSSHLMSFVHLFFSDLSNTCPPLDVSGSVQMAAAEVSQATV